MKTRFILCAALVGATVFGLAPNATAGGNWIEINDSHVSPGETVVADALAYVRDRLKAKRSGPYFAYLAPETYGWTLPHVHHARTIKLGKVSINWATMDASFRFKMPAVSPGEYLIAFCDRGCTHNFGDVDPTGGIQVFATSLEARVMQRINRLDAALFNRKYAERRARKWLQRKSAEGFEEVAGDMRALSERVQTLRQTVGAVQAGARPRLPSWVPIGAAALAAAAGFGMGRARTERLARRSLDRELNELVASNR
jgi:hypothetical protein